MYISENEIYKNLLVANDTAADIVNSKFAPRCLSLRSIYSSIQKMYQNITLESFDTNIVRVSLSTEIVVLSFNIIYFIYLVCIKIKRMHPTYIPDKKELRLITNASTPVGANGYTHSTVHCDLCGYGGEHKYHSLDHDVEFCSDCNGYRYYSKIKETSLQKTDHHTTHRKNRIQCRTDGHIYCEECGKCISLDEHIDHGIITGVIYNGKLFTHIDKPSTNSIV